MKSWFAHHGGPVRSELVFSPAAAGASPGIHRNRYLDLLRAVAIGCVVYGHWLLISVTYRNGQLSGADALDYVEWGRWVTWVFQVMPVFFLVGGYVNAQSWTAHHGEGQSWTVWVRDRAMRLWWPTAVFVVAGILAVAVATAAKVGPAELAQACWLAALQLWFLPVYLLLIALTPALLAAHRRWGLAVPAVMAAAAALVDKGVIGSHVHVIGYANYLFVWGSIHQWGFAWQDRTLTRIRWRPYALAAGGAALLAGLLASRRFMVDMVGSGNTNPPSIALLAFAAAQCGLVLAAEPAAARLLARARLWRRVSRLNAAAMTVYLWHFVPVIIIAVAFYPSGVMPQPAIGTAQWWELRPAWLALLTVVLVPLVMAVMRAERPMRRLPAGIGPSGPWSPGLLLVGLAASMFGLARLAIAGFAPGGHLPWLALAACAAGLGATLLTGRAPAAGAKPQNKDGLPWRTVPTFAAGVLASAAGGVLVWCRGPARADSAVTDRILRWWSGIWLRAAGARVIVDGLGQVSAAGPCMIVSNHQSLLDPIVHLHALPVSLRVLAMRELFRIPLFGRAMRATGMIEVDRESPDFREIDTEAARALAAGHWLLAYPEGRISPDGTIREFKDGAFVIAVAGQVPVVPVAIHGTGRIWPPGRRAIRAGQVRVVAGHPLPTSGLTHRDIGPLRDQAREVICAAHRDLVTAMEAPAVNGRQRRPSVAR